MSVPEKEKRIDVLSKNSELTGWKGLGETFIRRFRTLAYLAVMVGMVGAYIFSIGLSLFPGMMIYKAISSAVANSHFVVAALAQAVTLGAAYLAYGLSIIFVVPFFNFLNPFKLRPYRAPWFSNQSLAWSTHNALHYLVRYTFLEFITPLNVLYLRLMGMKIGKGSIVNTANISDPCLITVGDYVTIGGSVTIFAHYAQKGFVVCAPVLIKNGSTVGLKASIMGDVVVGEGAYVAPHAVVMPKTHIGAGEVFPKSWIGQAN